jgi:hypothetical protein
MHEAKQQEGDTLSYSICVGTSIAALYTCSGTVMRTLVCSGG